MKLVAALYVIAGGVYYGFLDVDPWPESRDARLYAGPHPVVAHPPCARWGRYARGGPSHHGRFEVGADGGCFAAALASVRAWGGVLEHPADSLAWAAHGLLPPPRSGGWVSAGDWRGWTCCVEQGHYGHLARKATWLYAVGCELPRLRWGSSGRRMRLDAGFHTAEERRSAVKGGAAPQLPSSQRSVTPLAFRDVLLTMARSAHPPCVGGMEAAS